VIQPPSDGPARETDFVVRRAEPADASSVLACLRAAFDEYRDQYTPEAFVDTVPNLDSLNDRLRTMSVYVAVSRGGKLIGTVAAAVTDNCEGHLRGMAVHPDFRSRGVAKELLAVTLNDLRAKGCRRVTLETTAPLTQAMHFYDANGFRRTGRVSDFFGMDLYEYAMSLER
jgi:ribosomal protein S18 acetylase RimI-like enzyme